MSFASANDQIENSAAGYAVSVARQEGLRTLATGPEASITLTVFFADNGIPALQSLKSLIRGSGSQVETFASAHEFLSRPPALQPELFTVELRAAFRPLRRQI
jgi:hypothetical protein